MLNILFLLMFLCVLSHLHIEQGSFIDFLWRDRVEGALKYPQVYFQEKHHVWLHSVSDGSFEANVKITAAEGHFAL